MTRKSRSAGPLAAKESPLPANKPSNVPCADMAIGELDIVHRIITEKLREQIFSGELAPGERLPSTVEIAAIWKTSKSTAHTALNNLVKEGLLARNHGSCTYVRERPLTLDRIGIYYDSPRVWTDEELVSTRGLHGLLEEKIAKLGIEVSVFIDRRPEAMQQSVLSELSRAIFAHEIQGLIVPIANGVNFPALLKLPLPLSARTSAGLSAKVCFDEKNFFREVLSRLSESGCRSVGLISSIDHDPDSPGAGQYSRFTEDFLKEAKNHSMATRSEWIKFPRKYITHKTIFGYKEFHSLWSLPDRPEAVVVFPDMVVRGVVAAVLELGVHRSNDVKFCFHRNSHVEVLCPFPALWAVNDGGRVADGLIDLVRRQHAGETVSPVKLSLEFQTSSGTV